MADSPSQSKLTTDPHNANKGTVRGRGMVERSLQQYGAGRSILVDRHGVAIAGNKTLETAQELGIPIQVIESDGRTLYAIKRTDLDLAKDDAAKELGIADNRASEAGLEWDANVLQSFMDDGIDLGQFWFEDELADVLAGDDEPILPGLTDPDDVPAVPDDPITKPGDIWTLGRHRVMCGDSTVVTDVDRLMDGKKADMVFTDPPYNLGFQGQDLSNTTENGVNVLHHKGANTKHESIKNDKMFDDEFDDFISAVLVNIQSHNTGAFYITFSDLTLDMLLTPMRRMGMNWKSIVVWNKNQATLSGKDYKSRYEPIVYGSPAGRFFGERYKQEDVWNFTRTLKNDLHPTMKPVELVAYAIENSSKTGDIVLDLFGGSGSTLIACEQTNRTAYLMELDEKYCDVIVSRWEKFTGQTATRVDDAEAQAAG